METNTCHSHILNMKTKQMNRDMFGSELGMNTSTEQKETITDTLSQGATLKISGTWVLLISDIVFFQQDSLKI